MRKKISDAYLDYVLEHSERPTSVYLFTRTLEISEAEFYNFFSSFESLESEFVTDHFKEVTGKLEADKEVYGKYMAREKFMAFLYSWVELGKENRSFYCFLEKQERIPVPVPYYFKNVRPVFLEWANRLIDDAIAAGEIKSRRYISDRYADAMFFQYVYIHKYWLKDNSTGFEKTDAAIEKSVRLIFDLMAQSAIDSAMDMMKFMFQNKADNG